MEKLLVGKVALVTGGTAGIGKAIAEKYAEEGAKVAIFGTNHERGSQIEADLCAKYGPKAATFYRVDVANTQEVDDTVKKVLENYGQVDILVNNAGITRDVLLMKMSEEDWDNVLAVNVKSCYNLCHALVRVMMKARKGKIINMSSVVGLSGNAGQINYAASKAAIVGMTKAMAKELAPRSIHVNCIAPGFIETRMTGDLNETQKEATLASIALGRMGSPEDIANAALFLGSHLSDYITGQVLTVDGGLVL